MQRLIAAIILAVLALPAHAVLVNSSLIPGTWEPENWRTGSVSGPYDRIENHDHLLAPSGPLLSNTPPYPVVPYGSQIQALACINNPCIATAAVGTLFIPQEGGEGRILMGYNSALPVSMSWSEALGWSNIFPVLRTYDPATRTLMVDVLSAPEPSACALVALGLLGMVGAAGGRRRASAVAKAISYAPTGSE